MDERTYKCELCGNIDDRDKNASKNILEEGLKTLNTAGTAGSARRKVASKKAIKKREKRLTFIGNRKLRGFSSAECQER